MQVSIGTNSGGINKCICPDHLKIIQLTRMTTILPIRWSGKRMFHEKLRQQGIYLKVGNYIARLRNIKIAHGDSMC